MKIDVSRVKFNSLILSVVSGGVWKVLRCYEIYIDKTYVCLYNEDSAEELQRIDV